MSVLTVSAGLLFILVLNIRLALDGLLVSNLGSVKLDIDLVAILELILDDLKVLL